MNKKQFYRFIENGSLQGACRYFEYWYIYSHLPKAGKVLELGAGKSMLPSAVKEKGLAITVTETDKASVDFQLEQGILSTPVEGSKLPFTDESYDVVIAASSIEHFEDDVETIKEIKRVLKKNGLFIMALPVGSTYIENKYEGMKHPKMRIYDKNTYTKRFLEDFSESYVSFYRMTDKVPTDYKAHATWKGKQNFEKASGFADNVGLCVVLKKK